MPHFQFYLSSFFSLLNHFISQLLPHSAPASRELAVLTPSTLSEKKKKSHKIRHKSEMLFLIVFFHFYFSSPALRGSPLPILQFPFPPLCLAGIPAPFCSFNSCSSTALAAFPRPGQRGAAVPGAGQDKCHLRVPSCHAHGPIACHRTSLTVTLCHGLCARARVTEMWAEKAVQGSSHSSCARATLGYRQRRLGKGPSGHHRPPCGVWRYQGLSVPP